MDVTFDTQKGNSFVVEIGFFDTVSHIKERIQKQHDIPASRQTLIFNGRVLDDGSDVEKCEILHNSRVQLVVSDDDDDGAKKAVAEAAMDGEQSETSPAAVKVQQQQQEAAVVGKRIRVVLRLTGSQVSVSKEVGPNETVGELKEKINELEGVPSSRIRLVTNGNTEMQDHRHISDYNLTDGSEIDVSVYRAVSSHSPSGGGGGMMTHPPAMANPRKLRIYVQPRCGTKKIGMDVNPSEKVQVLKNELEKLQPSLNFQLPSEGYFFIYKQNVMEDKESFHWHGVRQGDTIEMFNGSISGGL